MECFFFVVVVVFPLQEYELKAYNFFVLKIWIEKSPKTKLAKMFEIIGQTN